jgi:replicative DNA helicase
MGDNKNILQNERELIYLLLHYKEAIEYFYNYNLSADNFSEEYRPIILSILETYDRHNVLLTFKSFKTKLQECKVPKEKISQEIAFTSCYSARVEKDDLPLLVKSIVDQSVKKSINKSLEGFKKDINTKGDIPAVKQLMDNCQDILDGVESPGEKSYFEDIRVLSKSQTQYLQDVRDGKIKEEPLVLSGFKEIDYTMVTGFEKGTLTLICADVGGFKSSMMLNIGLNVWKNDHDVLFVPLEMEKVQMWRRACAREARVRAERITRKIKDLSDAEFEKIKKMNEAWETSPSKFYIMQEPGNTTVSKIERQIEKNIEIIQPKLVVIDYVANLEADKNRYGRNDLEIGDMLKSMRQMGKDMNFAVLSAAQLGREALKRIRKAGASREKTSINSEDIRGSHEYSADADNIYAQLKSSSQPNELLDIFCVKSRNGPTVFEDGNIRAVLDVMPEFGLIKTPSPVGAENEEPDGSEDYDLGDFIDKTEKDKVITANKMFNEEENIYNYDNTDSIDGDDSTLENNDDILNSIDADEDKAVDEENAEDEWNENW